MRKLIRTAMTAGAVVATAAALTAVPASAAPATYSVSPGGAVTAVNDGPVVAFEAVTQVPLVCQEATAEADVNGGAAVPGEGIATLNDVDFSWPGMPNDWCIANGNIPTRVTALNLPYTLDATGKAGADTTDGRLIGVKFELYAPSLPCTSVVGGPSGNDGYIEGTHTNPSVSGAPSTLSLNGANNLEVLSTTGSGCAGLIGVGHGAVLNATFNLTPGQTIN